MLFSSFSTRSMVFAYFTKAQLPFFFLSFETFFNDTAEFTLCYGLHDCSHLFQGYFIHSLSTLYYYNAPSLTTRLTGDYRDRTYTGKCSPALLDTHKRKRIQINSESFKSTRRDSNPRPSPWQGDTPPLSHSCKICCAVTVSATKHMIPENGTFVNRYFLSFRSFHFHSGSAGCPHTYCLGNLFPECCPVSGIPGQTTALLRSPSYVPVQYLHQRD